ncbi:MAG: hypothetical protein Unbinned4350contig1002_35 [Prokaryotic dsDNA virus sp.]|nr:MAG: hypothetical protein Unbinned4350contig1002_35 [Prokaryotic dsDNA virus sp.]|tara:strand:+ start:403 stop:546 length:144 start_codon:yes stop_codon:yes gene_type:complete
MKIKLDERHLETALEALAKDEPLDQETRLAQIEAIEAICEAMDDAEQ